MDETFQIATDTATLAVFDMALRREPLRDGLDWWAVAPPELARGELAMMSLGADGIYCIGVTDGELTAIERAYAADVVGRLGVCVTSGQVVIGGEALPMAGQGVTAKDDFCAVLPFDQGAYDVKAYWVDWMDSPLWWRDGSVIRNEAPADIVLVIHPRIASVAYTSEIPRLGVARSWVFPHESREIGPAAGMLLTTTVRKGPNGLSLKACGPSRYAATLVDYSAVHWKDKIQFRVVAVDHETARMVGEFVAKLPPDLNAP